MAAVFKGESVKLTVLREISAYLMADGQPEIVVNSSFETILNVWCLFLYANSWQSFAIWTKYIHGIVQNSKPESKLQFSKLKVPRMKAVTS